MKIRTDFVSNSSSSSFILQDVGFFKHFGITAADIKQALFELYYGSKDAYDKQLADAIKHCDDGIAKARKANEDLDGNYYVQRKKELLSNGLNAFVIFDMTDPVQREKCYKEWDEHFSNWIAPKEGAVNKWNTIEDVLRYECGFNNVLGVISGEDKEIEMIEYDDKKTDKWCSSTLLGAAKFVKLIKDKLGVKTMKEVLHDKKTTLMIHFNDNEVYDLDGMTEEDQSNASKNNSDEENKKPKSSMWESEMYSKDRFFEVLIKYFIDKGKIDLSDPSLMEYWLVPEDHWWKTNERSLNKDRKYFSMYDDHVTWKEVVDDMLCENSIMHEG